MTSWISLMHLMKFLRESKYYVLSVVRVSILCMFLAACQANPTKEVECKFNLIPSVSICSEDCEYGIHLIDTSYFKLDRINVETNCKF